VDCANYTDSHHLVPPSSNPFPLASRFDALMNSPTLVILGYSSYTVCYILGA